VTGPRDLFDRYVRQRDALSELPFFVDQTERRAAAQPPDEPRPAAVDIPPVHAERKTRRAGTKPSATERWRQDLPDIPPPGIVVAGPGSDLFSEDPLAGLGLEELAATVGTCALCSLSRSRANAVAGEGPAGARLVAVGEGPGATEDATGRPFVGRAGELLTEILAAIDLPREQVFICNVVKCRPPENRKPTPDEIKACVPYLHRQLEIIRPAVILAMGGTAAETLLDTRQSLGALRNKVHDFRGIPLIVTYHPAALLRNPNWKKPTWDDVRIARQLAARHG
jgi:DNA polymerase